MSEVRTIRPEEWRAYRDIRLAALKDSPDAFGSTYKDAILYSDELWQRRLQNINPTTDLPMTIVEKSRFVALGWVKIEQSNSQKANLYSMWVSPMHRGRGFGRHLVEAAIVWARQQGMKEMQLEVTCGNEAAEALYHSLGFHPIGAPLLLRQGSALLEQPMRLAL